MGLDQYAYAIKPELLPEDRSVAFELPETFDWDEDDFMKTPRTEDPVFGSFTRTKSGVRQLAYWRKHANLQGLVTELAKKKPHWNDETCSHWGSLISPVVLDETDIDEIERRTRDKTLPRTTGFFFGASDERDDEPTLEFCRRARVALAEGLRVVYYSSW